MKYIKLFEEFINSVNEELEYMEISNGDTTVSLYKNGPNWIEGQVIDGKKPSGWGRKTYQSYLSPEDIASWLNKDYKGDWEVTLTESNDFYSSLNKGR